MARYSPSCNPSGVLLLICPFHDENKHVCVLCNDVLYYINKKVAPVKFYPSRIDTILSKISDNMTVLNDVSKERGSISCSILASNGKHNRTSTENSPRWIRSRKFRQLLSRFLWCSCLVHGQIFLTVNHPTSKK